MEDPSVQHGTPSTPAVAPLEAEEVAFQRSWVAYLWARAALAGVEPQVGMLCCDGTGCAIPCQGTMPSRGGQPQGPQLVAGLHALLRCCALGLAQCAQM